jgi:hypothetical protein
VSAESDQPPTIFEWGGGRDAFERWLDLFYDPTVVAVAWEIPAARLLDGL